MLVDLRRALLAERGVRLAVLFGSIARGDEDQGSDIDLLVDLSDVELLSVTRLMDRLRPLVDRDVDIALLDRVQENAPLLLSRVMDEGQVIVDRDGVWADLQRQRHTIDAEAERSYRQQMKEAAKAIKNLTA
ncbi:MAG TPA: nucleotidyltransferase domain-containing protein [Solirubrobacterales bacterium]|nr:nucleotidyltransferase domain-containing protein [Solirubrobacterales bacterium]